MVWASGAPAERPYQWFSCLELPSETLNLETQRPEPETLRGLPVVALGFSLGFRV